MSSSINNNINAPAIADASALSTLKQKAAKDPSSAAKEAAQKFEALILQEVLKTGRGTAMESGLFSSEGTKTFASMMDKQLAEVAARKGSGLGEFIEKAITKNTTTK